MNGGVFGQLPFSQEAGGLATLRKVRAHDELMGQAGVSETAHRTARGSDALRASARLILSHRRKVNASDTFQSSARLIPAYFRTVKAGDDLEAGARLNALYGRTVGAGDNFDAAALLNVERHRRSRASDALQAFINLSRNKPRNVAASDDLNAFVDVISIIIEIDQLNLTIPPGGRLIIDTENYTAALVVNGVTTNAYRYHVGNFVKIDERVIDVDISAGTGGGGLSGFMMTQERYL